MEKDEDTETEKVKNLMKDLFTANPQHNEENPLQKKKKGSEKGSNEGSMQLSFEEEENEENEEEKELFGGLLLSDEEPLEIWKKTKIVSTLGPASESKEVITQLHKQGVNVFRLNFSHGNHETHGELIDRIRSCDIHGYAILLDTKGPEIRVGEVRDKLPLTIGTEFIMTIDQGVYEDTGKLSVNYDGFINDVDIGDVIVLDSGIIQAKAIEKNGHDIKFKVLDGTCDITSKRHVNLHGKKVSLETVTEQDWKDIDFGIEKKVDFIALSFVRTGNDPKKVREYCAKKGANIQVISKIESYEATLNLEDIVRNSDGIMYARGDLSCEIDFGVVPILQKEVCALCSYYNKPIIIATQMCLSLINNIQPTRAEVSDIGNAIFDGADAIMTSDETTKSIHPAHVIKVMSIICTETEDNLYAICTKPYCDDCFGIMHRGRLQRKGFENYTYHRPYHHIMKAKKDKKKQREFEKDMRRKLSVRLSQEANAENISDSLRNFRRNMSKRLSTRVSCISTDIFPNTLKENLFMIAPYITDDIEAIAAVENYNDYFIKNIAASRINIPMFGFSNNQMLVNQMILNWNVQPIFSPALVDDFRENGKIIDIFFKKRGVRKYLLCGLSKGTDDSNPTFQVRNINLFS